VVGIERLLRHALETDPHLSLEERSKTPTTAC